MVAEIRVAGRPATSGREAVPPGSASSLKHVVRQGGWSALLPHLHAIGMGLLDRRPGGRRCRPGGVPVATIRAGFPQPARCRAGRYPSGAQEGPPKAGARPPRTLSWRDDGAEYRSLPG